MSVQSTIYDLETTDIRFFLSTKPIASKSHVAIWIKGDDDIYRITNESEYELINDNIVFPTHPSGKALELRVGDTPSDLVQAPNDIAIVSAIAGEVVIVADSMQDVVTVSENITQVTIVSDNMTELLVISADIDLVLLSKEYAINPEDTAITGNPTDFSSLHYSKKAEEYAVQAQSVIDSVNFPAGLIMEWDSDIKPAGWLWCDGESYSVFSPNPALAYDELYQFRVDPTYVMTTKPTDWDTNYPDDPNGWYDPLFVGSVVTQAELDLIVTVPDRRGVFVRGKDQAGTVLQARGFDSHGVVPFDTVIQSQNKAHTHTYSKWTTLGGGLYDTGGANNGQSTATDSESEGGVEGHGTYTPTNYIIRAKGSYNGNGSGSGGTGIVPTASEIPYSDTYGNGKTNLQDTTDYLYFTNGLERVDIGLYVPPAEEVIGEVYISYNLGSQLYGQWLILGDQNGVYRLDTDTGTSTQLIAGDYRGVVTSDFDNGYTWIVGASLIVRVKINITTGAVEEIISKTALHSGHSCAVHPTNPNKIYYTNFNNLYLYDISDESTVDYSTVLGTGGLIVSNGRDLFTIANGSQVVGLVTLTGDVPSVSATTFQLPFNLYIKSEIRVHYSFDSDNSMCLQLDSDQRFFILDFNYDTELIEQREEIENPAVGNVALPHPVPVVQDARYAKRTWLVRVSTNSKVYYFNTDPSNRKHAYRLQDSSVIGEGIESVGLGDNVKSQTDGGVALGKNNLDTAGNILEVGIGVDSANKANGLEVSTTGDVQAQNRLASPNAKSLITKDIGDGLYHAKEATTFTGTFLIANGDTVTVNNGIITSVAP